MTKKVWCTLVALFLALSTPVYADIYYYTGAGGGGSGTVGSGTAGQGTYYATTGTAVSGNPNESWSTGTVTIGQANTVAGAVVLEGGTSGSVTLNVPTVAGSTTFTLPGTNGTNGQLLQTNGSGVTSWVSGLSNPMTTLGDMISGGAGGASQRLAIGRNEYVLQGAGANGSVTPVWQPGGTKINSSIHPYEALNFRAALAQVINGTGSCEMLCLGDSETRIALPSDVVNVSWPTRLINMLRTVVPCTDGVILPFGATTIGSGTPIDTRYTLGTGWVINVNPIGGGTNPSGFMNGGDVEGPITASGDLTLAPGFVFDTLQVYYFKHSGGGTFTANVDGGSSLGSTATSNASTVAATVTFTVPRGIHTVHIPPPTVGTVDIAGIECTDSTVPSVHITNGGVASAKTADIINSGNYDLGMSTTLLNPAITNVQIGVNDAAASVSSGTFIANLTSILGHYSAAGSDVVIGTSNPCSAGTLATNYAAYYPLMVSLAATNPAGLLDFYARAYSYAVWNGAGFNNSNHPSNTGASDNAMAALEYYFGIASSVSAVPTQMAQGGTNANLVASTGAVAYSTSSAIALDSNATLSTGTLTLGSSGTAGSIVLNGSSSGIVTLGVPSAAGTTTFTLPSTNGTNGYFLQTNGSGVTSWAQSTVNSGTSGQMAYYASSAAAVSGNANATISNGALTLGQSGTAGSITLNGSASGTGVIQVASAAGAGIVFQIPSSNGSNGQFLQTNGSGVTSWQAAAGVAPSVDNYRLSLATGVPVTTTDQSAKSTIYLTPYIGEHISLLSTDGATWLDDTPGEISATITNIAFGIIDVFAVDTAGNGTVTLAFNDWTNGSQTTGTITGATAANPCVVTATNTLSNGQLVGISGVVGTMGTDANKGLNGKVFPVSSVSGSAFTLAGIDTTGLTYTSGGTFTVVPTARGTALGKVNNILVQDTGSTAHKQNRYVGTVVTGTGANTSGQTSDSAAQRLMVNYYNRKNANLKAQETAASWAYAAAAIRPSNAGTTVGVSKVECLAGLVEDTVTARHYVVVNNATAGNNSFLTGIGLNSYNTDSSMTGGTVISNLTVDITGVGTYEGYLNLGYNFLQRLEKNSSATTLTYEGTNSNTIQTGLVGTTQH